MSKVYGLTAKEYAERLLSGVLKHKVSVEEGKGGFDYDDVVIRLDGYIEVYELQDMVVSESLLGEVRGTGYEIGRVKHYDNYPFAPDDYDYEGEDEQPTMVRAVESAVRMAMEDELQREIRGIAEEHYAKEYEEREHEEVC